MVRLRVSLVVYVLLGASLIAQSPVWAQPSSTTRLVSIRYGYTLTLAPGWVVTKGDCAPFAVVASADSQDSIAIHVTTVSPTGTLLLKAEDTILHTSGALLGAATHGTLHLHGLTYQRAQAVTRSGKITDAILVAGIVRNHLTYILVDTVRAPASRAGMQHAKAAQSILSSFTLVKPAPAGSFICAGGGISRRITGPATPSASLTPSTTATVVPSSTASVTPTPSSTLTPAPTATPTPAASPLPAGVPTSGSTTNGCPITYFQATGEPYLLGLLNADRAAAGAAPLTLSPALSVVARDHSCDMGKHFTLGHTGSDGTDPGQRIAAAGITAVTSGENVGTSAGNGFLPAIQILDQDMMAEPPTLGTHHWNIINPAYHEVGIGVIILGQSVWITEDFVG